MSPSEADGVAPLQATSEEGLAMMPRTRAPNETEAYNSTSLLPMDGELWSMQSTQPRRRRRGGSWEGAGEAVTAGIDLITSVAAAAEDPSVAAVGAAVSSVAGLAALIPAPPANFVIAGVLGVIGGLMSLFGGQQGPGIQDVLDAMEEGFQRVHDHLDYLSQQIEELRDEFHDVYRFHLDDLFEIHQHYNNVVSRYQIAADRKTPQDFQDFRVTVAGKFAEMGHYTRGVLDPENLEQIIRDRKTSAQAGDKTFCKAAAVFRKIVTARWELYHIFVLEEAFRDQSMNLLVTPGVATRTEDLQRDMESYSNVLAKFGGELQRAILEPDGAECQRSCFGSTCGKGVQNADCTCSCPGAWHGPPITRDGFVHEDCTHANITCVDRSGLNIRDGGNGLLGALEEDDWLGFWWSDRVYASWGDYRSYSDNTFWLNWIIEGTGPHRLRNQGWYGDYESYLRHSEDGDVEFVEEDELDPRTEWSIERVEPSESGWRDSSGDTCQDYEANGWCTFDGGFGPNWNSDWGSFHTYAHDGLTAPTACYACGGNHGFVRIKNVADGSDKYLWLDMSGRLFVPRDVSPANGYTNVFRIEDPGCWAKCWPEKYIPTVPPLEPNQWTPCEDIPGWVDSTGYSCSDYDAQGWCTADGGYGDGWSVDWGKFADWASSDGRDATIACCACGK